MTETFDEQIDEHLQAQFDEHLQAQIEEQMAVEQHIFEAQLRTCGTPPHDLLIVNTSANPSSEEQLFHEIISNERNINSKVQY